MGKYVFENPHMKREKLPIMPIPFGSRGTSTKKDERSTRIVVIVIFVASAGLLLFQGIQHYRSKKMLSVMVSQSDITSMNAQHITLFRIYPRIIRPVGEPVQFKAPDSIIQDFFQSLKDIQSSWASRDTVDSQDHSWFLEVAAGGDMIQIHFYIPSGKGDIVAGEFGKWGTNNSVHYGSFQSKLLFQWYQKYKDRWLKPDGKEGGEEGEKKSREEEQKLGS